MRERPERGSGKDEGRAVPESKLSARRGLERRDRLREEMWRMSSRVRRRETRVPRWSYGGRYGSPRVIRCFRCVR